MRNLVLAVFLILAPGFSVISGLARGNDGVAELTTFLDEVELRAGSIQTFTCDFKQTRYLSIFPEPVRFSGRLVLARPDRLRWEFTEPIPSVLILNGHKGFKCNEGGPTREFDLDQDPVMRLVAEQLRAWTSGTYRDLQKDFDFELSGEDVLLLTPAKAGAESFINGIRVSFDPEFLQPREIEISEPGGDRTVISFTAYLRNMEIPMVEFTNCGSNWEMPVKDE